MRVNLFKSGGNAAGTGGFVSNGLALQGPLILSGPHNEPLHAVPKQYVDDSVYNLDATRITSGVLPTGRLPVFTGDVTNVLGSNVFVLASVGITAGSYVKPTVDAKGRITAGGTLTASDIANVGWEKISVGRPTTLSGYGITDAVNADNGSMTGELTLHADPVLDTHAVTKQFVDGIGGTSGGVSVGDIVRKTCLASPDGFLRCNGAEVDKTTYSGLYSIIGDTFSLIPRVASSITSMHQPFNASQTSDLVGWTTEASFPTQFTYSVAFVTKNRVHVLSGDNGSGVGSSTVYTAAINSDGSIGTWTTGTSLPGAIQRSNAVITKNRVYMLGGYTNTTVATVYTAPINADGTLGTWTTGTSLPVTIYNTKPIVIKNKIYIIGGYNGSSWVNTIYVASINIDGTIGTWSLYGTTPIALQSHAVIVIKNKLWIIGASASSYISNVWSATINSDETLGTWTDEVPLPLGLGAQVFVTKNRVYLLSGATVTTDPFGTIYASNIRSDGSLGTWVIAGSMTVPIRSNALFSTSSRIYSVAGWNGSVNTSAVYSTPITGGLNDYSSYYTADETNYLMSGSGKPWQLQYQINTTHSGDISGWTMGTSLPGTQGGGAIIATKNRVYACGGYSGASSSAVVYTAPINSDGTLGTWTTDVSLPGALYATQGVVTKNRVYLLGGYLTGAVSTVYTAPINSDGTIGTWTTGTSLHTALYNSQAIVTKNRVYLIGGYEGATSATVYTAPIDANGVIGTWVNTGPTLPAALGWSSAIVTNNRVYMLGGGVGGGSASNIVYTAPINSDGTLGAWSTGTSLPGNLMGTIPIVIKNRVYLLGGNYGSTGSSITSSVYTAPINADGTLGTWTTSSSSLASALYTASGVVITNSKVYLIGGYYGPGAPYAYVQVGNITGSLNDYSPYYDGTIQPAAVVVPNTFALPDYTIEDKQLSDYICSYIKY
jgi:N-acetylneuraminic acid mutarotase